MRDTTKQAFCAAALVLLLALPGCAGSALLGAQGPTVDAAALRGSLTEPADVAAAPAPAADAVPGTGTDTAAWTDPVPADRPEESAALTVGPSLGGNGGSAAQAVAIWSGLQRLRDTVTDYPVELAIGNILQNPELPNGCEITSAAIALNYLGIPADKMVLARDYLPKGENHLTADPETEYMGSPFAGEVGYYCMPRPVAAAVNAYLADIGNTALQARDISGADIEELQRYLHAGTPVLVWITRNFEEPRFASHFTLPDGSQPYTNLHCVVLTGYDGERFYFTDPLDSDPAVDAETFAHIYETMGRHALVIAPR